MKRYGSAFLTASIFWMFGPFFLVIATKAALEGGSLLAAIAFAGMGAYFLKMGYEISRKDLQRTANEAEASLR